ncbi:MAG: hypothetical protein ACT4P5_09035, partial [Armatimonadota bacterium]
MKRLIAVFLVLGLAIVPGLVTVKESAGQAARPKAIVEGGNAATPVSWARLPRVAQRATRVAVPRFSDLDPATLRRLKSEAARGSAPGAGVAFPRTPRLRTPEGALPPTTLFSFEGPSQADNNAAGFLSRPPDPDIAVGPNHVGVVVNQQFTVFSKGGVQLAQTALAVWFAGVCAGCSPFDPRIAYDPWENRWIVIALELTRIAAGDPADTSRLLVSVSTTSDPTGAWCSYNIDAKFSYDPPGPAGPTDVWLDYPDVGFDAVLSTAPTSGAIYLTGANFTFSPFGFFQTSSARVIPKSALYACAVLPAYFHYIDFLNSNGTQAFTLRAAKTYGSNPGVEYMVNSSSSTNFISLWAITPAYPPAAPSAVLQANVVVAAYAVAPDATQPGCANLLDTIGNRSYNAVWRNNRIYTALTAASGAESQVRYYKINTMTNAPEFDAGFATPGEFSFMPAVTVDLLENLYISYARSGPGTFGQLDQFGRQGASVFFGPTIKTGVQCITGLRWGDYFGAAIDPVGFRRAWLFGQWASNEACCDSVWDWSTWIARVQFSVLTTIGLYNGATSTFFLRDSNSAGPADL